MSDWTKTLDRHTPFADLESLVARQVERALADLRRQVAADPDLAGGEQAVLDKARPLIEERTRAEVSSAWLRLQSARTM